MKCTVRVVSAENGHLCVLKNIFKSWIYLIKIVRKGKKEKLKNLTRINSNIIMQEKYGKHEFIYVQLFSLVENKFPCEWVGFEIPATCIAEFKD